MAIDALVGYSLAGLLHGDVLRLTEALIGSSETIISLDNPSGLDVSSGASSRGAVRADATLTLCLPKVGLRTSNLVGALYVADIPSRCR